MGGVFSGLFGGNYSAPEPVEIPAAPVREEIEPETKAAREEERRKIRARSRMNGTILTSPLGTTGAANNTLGRTGPNQ